MQFTEIKSTRLSKCIDIQFVWIRGMHFSILFVHVLLYEVSFFYFFYDKLGVSFIRVLKLDTLFQLPTTYLGFLKDFCHLLCLHLTEA